MAERKRKRPEDMVSPKDRVFTDQPKPIKEAIVVGAQSKTIWGLLYSQALLLLGVVSDTIGQGLDLLFWLLGVLPALTAEVGGQLGTTSQLAGWLRLNVTGISVSLVCVLLVVALVRHWRDKIALEKARKAP